MFNYLLCGLFVILSVNILWYVILFYKYSKVWHIPGPTPVPFIGSLLSLLGDTNTLIQRSHKLMKKYGPTAKFFKGSHLVLTTSEQELIELLLKPSKHTTKDIHYDYLKPWLGNGMLLAKGDYWKKLRKIGANAFNLQSIHRFSSTYNSLSKVLIENLTNEIKDAELINIDQFINSMTLDMICETAFGTKLNAQQSSEDNAHISALKYLTGVVFSRLCSTWQLSNFLYQFSSDYRTEMKAIKTVNDSTMKIITARKNKLKEENHNAYITPAEDMKTKFILIDHLFNTTIDDRPLSTTEILDFLKIIIFAGYDTTASTLNFLIYELSRNPEVQNKLLDEIKEVFADDKHREVLPTDISKMQYMELVIKETLRFYSNVPVFARYLEEEVDFKGTIIPKNTSVIFFSLNIHQSAKYFPDPHKFNPERFLDEKNTIPFTFLGYSAGIRNCIGIKYSKALIKTAMINLLRNFEFSSAGPEYNVKIKPGIVLSSLNGFHVKIKKRDF